MLRTQVLVIGGGPAGSTAAKFLAGNGIETLLVDKNFSFVKPCGGGVPSTLFHELDIPESSIKKYVDTLKIVSPKGEVLHIKLRGGSLAIVERGDFDWILRSEAEKAGAILLEGEFRNFSDIGSTATAEIMLRDSEISSESSDQQRKFVARKKLPHHCSIRADYVIAADGVNSRVRAALNIKSCPAFLTLSEKIKGENTDVCEFWFGSSHAPQCYSWVFPQREGISAGTAALGYPGIRSLWQKFVERRGLRTDGSLRGYKIPLWQGDLYDSGRILFAGDAAGQVVPFTYEGIYYALKSGEILAKALISGKPGDYKRLWESSFGKRFKVMRKLWTYFMKGDQRAEKIVQLHKMPEVQEAAMNLWLKKDMKKESLRSYIKIFRRFLD